jgi:hypothetical protein
MMKTPLIAIIVAIGIISHVAVWCFGWRTGIISLGKMESRLRLPITMLACRALQTNDMTNLRRALYISLSSDIWQLSAIETDTDAWVEHIFDTTEEMQWPSHENFMEVSMPKALEKQTQLKEQIAEQTPGT